MAFKVGILVCLLFLFYQDLRYRAVYWILFPVLLLLLVASAFSRLEVGTLFINSGINLAFVFLQLILLTLYFSLKNKRWVNITSEYLGWGDVLFLLTIAFYLSPLNYLFFYLSSLFLVLLFSIVPLLRKGPQQFKIPLAGLQALFFALFLFADWNTSEINLQSDEWLINFIL